MKTLLSLTILILTTFSCVSKQTPKAEKSTLTGIQKKVEKAFRQVSDFPTIIDTAKFITDLRQTFDIRIDENPLQKANEKITTYKKVKLYGSDKDYFFVESDYGEGCNAAYPWKYQLLLTTDGKLIKKFSGQRFDFVSIFPNNNPLLLIVNVTARGNGGHEFYKIIADSIENIYEGYYNFDIQTFDSSQDHSVFEPNELNINFLDDNRDGYNDIVFTGNELVLEAKSEYGVLVDFKIIDGKEIPYSVESPAKITPVKYVFLYDKQTGHFKAKENYDR